MSTRLWPSIIVLILMFVMALPSSAQLDTNLSAIYSQFDTDDGLARAVAFRDFEREVSQEQRAKVLSQLLTKSLSEPHPNLVASTVIGYLNSKKVAVNTDLQNLMAKCAKSPSLATREAYLNFLTNHIRPEGDSTVIDYLDDSNDKLRERALDCVMKSTGGKKKVAEYVAKHAADPTYADSVKRAKKLMISSP